MELVAVIVMSVRPGRRLLELQHGPLPCGHPDFEEVDLPADQRFFVTLVPGDTKVLTRPDSEAPVLFTVADTTEHFEVMVLLSSWACMVVPGYGCGWARSAAIASQVFKPTKCVAMKSKLHSFSTLPQVASNVKHLVRSDRDLFIVNLVPFVRLLQMIGHLLVGLDAELYAIEYDDVEEILEACPNLTYLNIGSSQLTDLSVFVEYYRSGRCKITSLNVTSQRERNEMLLELAELLAEPAGAVLLEVAAGGPSDLININPKPFMALSSAVQVNKTLRYLQLSCEGLDTTFLSQVEANMLQREGAHRVRSTAVAFLSVIGASPEHLPSIRSLDAKMLSNLLDFAGIPVKRICTV